MITPTGPNSASAQTSIRRAEAADWAKLAEFYQRCFPERTRLNDAKLWHWQFVDQPAPDGSLPFFVLEADGRIEGAIGYLRLTLFADGKPLRAIHPVNYFVNPKFTGLPALQLFRAVTREAPVVLGSYISGDARRLLLKSGYIDLGAHMREYYAALHPTAALSRRSRIVTRARLIWTRFLSIVTRPYCGPFEYVHAPTLDPAWAQHVAHWRRADCQPVKTAAELAWRYQQSPALHPLFFWQIRGETPVGFAVLHIIEDKRTAVILDWNSEGATLCRDFNFIFALIRFAQQRNIHYLVTDALSSSSHRALRWCGFGQRVSELGFMVYGQDAEIRKVIADSQRWHFMVGDTDRY